MPKFVHYEMPQTVQDIPVLGGERGSRIHEWREGNWWEICDPRWTYNAIADAHQWSSSIRLARFEDDHPAEVLAETWISGPNPDQPPTLDELLRVATLTLSEYQHGGAELSLSIVHA
jgi:hypothetical protein